MVLYKGGVRLLRTSASRRATPPRLNALVFFPVLVDSMQILVALLAVPALFTGVCSAGDQVVLAAINDPCTGAGGAPGVCIATAGCTSGGGQFISGACPGTPDDIRLPLDFAVWLRHISIWSMPGPSQLQVLLSS